MPLFLEEQESRREVLSAAPTGAPIIVATDLTTAADVTLLHEVVDGNVDAVWLQVWNNSAASVDFNLVISPAAQDSPGVAAALVTVTIPPKDSYWVMQGDSLRYTAGVDALACYVLTGDVGKLKVTGYVVRTKGALLY